MDAATGAGGPGGAARVLNHAPEGLLEAEVLDGLQGIVGIHADADGFTRRVNGEVQRLWEEPNAYHRNAAGRLQATDGKIASIRAAIGNGLGDARWENTRLEELFADEERIADKAILRDAPPEIDAKTAMSHRGQPRKVLAHDRPGERKGFVQTWVD